MAPEIRIQDVREGDYVKAVFATPNVHTIIGEVWMLKPEGVLLVGESFIAHAASIIAAEKPVQADPLEPPIESVVLDRNYMAYQHHADGLWHPALKGILFTLQWSQLLTDGPLTLLVEGDEIK